MKLLLLLLLVASVVLAHTASGQNFSSIYLNAVVRDFNVEATPFERYGGSGECGTVEDVLGPDRKPILYGGVTPRGQFLPATCSLGGSGGAKRLEYFQNFFRDVPGHNLRFQIQIELTEQTAGSGVYILDRKLSSPVINQWFPINGLGWGHDIRQTKPKTNFGFTMEVHADFIYRGNEDFAFAGDDDVYVFVDGKLVVDLGGLHGELSGSVSLPAVADKLGLVVGQRYPFDFFLAERHWSQSNCQITTTIAPANERPQTQPSSFRVKVGESVTIEFQAFDANFDVLTYTLTISDELAPLLTVAADSKSAVFTAPASLDDKGLNDTETDYVYSMSFTVADSEYSACPSDVTITVVRDLVAPVPPAPTPPPPDNTNTIILASIGAVLALLLIIGLIALALLVRSKAEAWRMEVLQELNLESMGVSPIYVAETEDFVSPIYDADQKVVRHGDADDTFF